MMTDIVFSSEGGAYLNKETQSKIAKHLFLLCNYNVDSFRVFSEDARFFQAALNMYKFIVDAGICANLKVLGKENKVSWNDKRFKEISDIVVAIRTTLCHNVDGLNGTDEDKERAKKWLQKVIGKDEIISASDYTAATNKLIEYGSECVSILDQFVSNASSNVNVQNIIHDWEKIIISFYQRGNSKKILEAQLMMAYYAKIGGGHKPNRFMVAEWVKKMINADEISQINSMNEALRIKGLPNSSLILINERIENCKENIKKREKEILRVLGLNKPEPNSFDYMDYYIKTIPQRIDNELSSGNVTSLLPQDVVQQIIVCDFQNISVM